MELELDIIYINNLVSKIIIPDNLIIINILFNSDHMSTICILGDSCESEHSINLDIMATEQCLP